MEKIPSLFERFMFEAPGDDPPDTAPADTGPPDMPADAPADDGPPDIPDDEPDDMGADDDSPPDMDGGDSFSDEGDAFDDGGGDDDFGSSEDGGNPEQGLDDKVSAIMNMNLYQRYLTLLTQIGSQLTTIKNNIDVLYTLSPESLDIVKSLNKLDENVRLYLSNTFLNENYSKNLLFFNKCLNLLKLLNDSFGTSVRKGIKDMK